MTASRLSPAAQQRIAILVPIVALVVSVFVVYPSYLHNRELQDEIAKKSERLNNLLQTPMPLAATVQPAAADTPSEPPEFLASIRELAAESRCELVGFDLTLPPAPPSGEKELALGGNKPEGATKSEDTSPVRPVRAKIAVKSDYDGVRQLLRGIILAPRLYAVTACEVMPAGDPGVPDHYVRATIEIERYVLKNPEDAKVIAGEPAAGSGG